MAPDRSQVLSVVEQLLDRVNKPCDELTDETPLYGEGLGLDSLEAAELSALLEDEFGSDPVSAGEGMPETVGEILAFYAAAASA